MIQYYILDDEHNPVPVADVLDWAKWSEDRDRRRVAYDEIYVDPDDGSVQYVSTIFIGFNLDVLGRDPPLLFETLDTTNEEWEITRHSTWWEAVAFHDQEVMAARNRYVT